MWNHKGPALRSTGDLSGVGNAAGSKGQSFEKLCNLTPAVLARHLHEEVIPNNPQGFSFAPILWSSNPPVQPDSFIVSLKGSEGKGFGFPSHKEILAWLEVHLMRVLEINGLIGGWTKGAFFYLDVSIVVWGWERANLLAWINAQTHIFDYGRNKDVAAQKPRTRIAI